MRVRAFTAVSIVAALIGGALLNAAPATACSQSARCYGTVLNSTSNLTGVGADLAPTCMAALPAYGVSTQQLWLANSTENSWVEVGFLRVRGSSVGDIFDDGLYAFWGDQRPGSIYYTHVIQTNPTFTSKSATLSKGSAANTFNITFATYSGLSTGNTMTIAKGMMGAETDVNGVHNYGKGLGVRTKVGSAWTAGLSGTKTYRTALSFAWVVNYTQYTAGSAC